MKFKEDDDGCKRSGEDHRSPELMMKKSKNGGDEKEDLELMMKSDSEISKILARTKKNLQLLGDKLADKGEKIKETIRRYDDELQRRNKLQSNKKISTTSSPDRVAAGKPSNGVDALVNEMVEVDQLAMKTESEIREPIAKHTDNLQTVVDKLLDKDDNLLKITLCRNEDELEQRNKKQSYKKDSTTSSPDRLSANKPSESHSGVATNALPVDTTKHDSLTDEKMQKIVNELINVGISETDVGKAAEICYNDPVKVKVLFALPSHLRKFFVWGFLRNSA